MPKKQVTQMSELEAIKAELAWLRQVIEAYGVKGPWVSPQVAAAIHCLSRNTIMRAIYEAERLRAIHKPSDLLYGVHYRAIGDVNSSPSWQVNLIAWGEFLKIPPERRKTG